MKHVINSKVYDTETATRIAGYFYGNSTSDFYYVDETLYRSQKGQFFLCGEGGAASEYREQEGSSNWTNGSKSTLMNTAEALEWCERRLIRSELILEHFESSFKEG